MAQDLNWADRQIEAMRARWPQFDVTQPLHGLVAWFGQLVGVSRPYQVMIEYDTAPKGAAAPLLTRIPLVRVLSPRLRPNWNAIEEAPLPHVFFDEKDISLSPLCLFDPEKKQWTAEDLIANTIVLWTVDWLACYEGWLATGRWHGGGRHAPRRESAGAR